MVTQLIVKSHTITSHDSGEIFDVFQHDFSLRIYGNKACYSSLHSHLVEKDKDWSKLWKILIDAEGKTECFGMDTALIRNMTYVKIEWYSEFDSKEFKIIINHYEGRGESDVLNGIINEIVYNFNGLRQSDLEFFYTLSNSSAKDITIWI